MEVKYLETLIYAVINYTLVFFKAKIKININFKHLIVKILSFQKGI